MIVGIDFDNTVVCYDKVFHRLALEKRLIPPDLDGNKSSVRNYLRQAGKEDLWTELQGMVYGTYIEYAVPFHGVADFFGKCKATGTTVYVISHKTEFPYLGKACNLHDAAHRWLKTYLFYDPDGMGLQRANVYLELTKADKISRIAATGCDYFVDDLPEFLKEKGFADKTTRILFDPNRLYASEGNCGYVRADSWTSIGKIIFGKEA